MSSPIAGFSPEARVLVAPSPPAASSPSPAGPPAPDFRRVLERIGREVDSGEALVKRALTGGAGADAAELIALQAGIYRYTEAVDLASKLVDRVGSAVRTTLQSQG